MEDEYESFEVTDYDLENEFNISRPYKKLSKNQQIYGIWADDSEDEYPNKERISSRGSKPSYITPLSFVSGGTQETKEKNDEHSKDQYSSSDEELVVKAKRRPKQLSAEPSSQIGNWQKHTKGIGHKLLLQMGYQPGKGLGKELQGISAPVEAHKRQGRGAIGAYGSERKQVISEENTDETEETYINNWKKSSGKKKKIKYMVKTIDEVLESGKFISTLNINTILSQVKVIDMTGPQQRVLSGYHAIHGQKQPEQEKFIIEGTQKATGFAMPELLHNLDLLVDRAEKEILQMERSRCTANDRIINLKHEKELLQLQLHSEKESIEKLTCLLNIISTFENASSFTLEELSEIFVKLQNDYPEDYKIYGLENIAISVVFPLIKTFLQTWQPLEDQFYGINLFQEWKNILDQTLDSDNEENVYYQMIWQCWMPRVRAAVSIWHCRNSTPLTELLENWMPLLPHSIMSNLLEQTILPRIQREVENWNPLTDTVPIHAWIHPWLPLMGNVRMEILYPTIRYKLANALINWHPSDRSSKLIITPWMKVWNSSNIEIFLIKNIIPKLQMALQELVINPHQQHLDQWNWVMEWKNMLSPATLASLLDKAFFPKWLQVLAAWLNHNPSYEEITKWYLGWKSMIPEPILSVPLIKEHLRTALEMMQRSVGIEPISKERTFYDNRLPEYSFPISCNAQVIPQGFRELLERRCAEQNILFVPLRQYDGKQVYNCGNLQLYIDRNVLFVLKNGKWVPTSLQNVLDEASSD